MQFFSAYTTQNAPCIIHDEGFFNVLVLQGPVRLPPSVYHRQDTGEFGFVVLFSWKFKHSVLVPSPVPSTT